MRFLGFEFRRVKSTNPYDVGWVPLSGPVGRWRIPSPDLTLGEMTSFSAVFGCLATLAGDVSKLRIRVMTRLGKIWTEDSGSASLLLARPNHFQTRAQFFESWMHSRLLYGNTFVLLQRPSPGGKPFAMYILDPTRVQPVISDSGAVFYRVSGDKLAGLREDASQMDLTIPARDIIHDRVNTFFHPLIGTSPIAACAWSTKVGVRIQAQAAGFFENGASPGGLLTGPAGMSDEDAQKVQKFWDESFTGTNAGKIAVVGADLRYQQLAISATDAQLIEQLKFSAEDVARAFRIPPHMIGAAPPPAYANVEALTLSYYSQTLQVILEQIEGALDAGLGLPSHQRVEFDVEQLLRMDTAARYASNTAAVGGGWMAPNEARARENLPPVESGETPYLQQQNWSLSQLANRTPPADAPSGGSHQRGHQMRSQIARQALEQGFSDELAARKAGLPPGWSAKAYVEAVRNDPA